MEHVCMMLNGKKPLAGQLIVLLMVLNSFMSGARPMEGFELVGLYDVCPKGKQMLNTIETMTNDDDWWQRIWGRTGASWPRRGLEECWRERGDVCALPDADHIVCLPGSRRGSTANKGWALDPKGQTCQPGVHCLYACEPGFYWTMFNNSETSNFDYLNGPKVGHCDGTWDYGTSTHGIYCKEDGTLDIPTDRPLCQLGETYVYAENRLDTHVFLCQTVFPGHEIFMIPTLVRPGESVLITTQPKEFWSGPTYNKPTHGDFYVSFAGADIMEACTWDEFSPSGASMLPYEIGNGVEDNGFIYSTHYFYQQPNSEVPSSKVGYAMDLECESSEPGVCGEVFRHQDVVKVDTWRKPQDGTTKVKFIFKPDESQAKFPGMYTEPIIKYLDPNKIIKSSEILPETSVIKVPYIPRPSTSLDPVYETANDVQIHIGTPPEVKLLLPGESSGQDANLISVVPEVYPVIPTQTGLQTEPEPEPQDENIVPVVPEMYPVIQPQIQLQQEPQPEQQPQDVNAVAVSLDAHSVATNKPQGYLNEQDESVESEAMTQQQDEYLEPVNSDKGPDVSFQQQPQPDQQSEDTESVVSYESPVVTIQQQPHPNVQEENGESVVSGESYVVQAKEQEQQETDLEKEAERGDGENEEKEESQSFYLFNSLDRPDTNQEQVVTQDLSENSPASASSGATTLQGPLGNDQEQADSLLLEFGRRLRAKKTSGSVWLENTLAEPVVVCKVDAGSITEDGGTTVYPGERYKLSGPATFMLAEKTRNNAVSCSSADLPWTIDIGYATEDKAHTRYTYHANSQTAIAGDSLSYELMLRCSSIEGLCHTEGTQRVGILDIPSNIGGFEVVFIVYPSTEDGLSRQHLLDVMLKNGDSATQ